MKKNLLKAALVFGSAFLLTAQSYAQVSSEVRDYYDSNLVTGDTIHFWVGMGTLHVYNFNQYNISSVPVTYKVRKVNLQLMNGAHSNFCIYHNDDLADPQSQCYIPSVTMSGTFTTDPGEYNTLLAEFNPGTTTPGVSIVRYTFFDNNNAADSVILTLVYNATPVGMTESFVATLGEPYPNPATDIVSAAYHFSNENGGNAVVTDLTGKAVYSQALYSRDGILQLETSAWAKGIYMISLTDENGIAARRKIVVQ